MAKKEAERQARKDELLSTVNTAMQSLDDGASSEQLDLVMLAAGFNPKAVRSFARVLMKQETAATAPPPDLDAGVKWARAYLDSAVDDLLAAGGSHQVLMVAAQSLPSYVAAKAKAKGHEQKRRPTPGNGVTCCEDEG